MIKNQTDFECVIVGAGVVGLSVAEHSKTKQTGISNRKK